MYGTESGRFSSSVKNYANKPRENKMTKSIRIENADNSKHNVEIEIWENDKLVSTKRIDYPTQMETLTIWEGRELRIKEVK